jgi:peroxiredoxin
LQVITVGMGEPKHAERYCGKLAPSVNCLADESHEAYATYGLYEMSAAGVLSPSLLKASVRALAGGFRQEITDSGGDLTMLPGTFIIDRGGIVRYTYYSIHAGDHPKIADLLAEAKRL